MAREEWRMANDEGRMAREEWREGSLNSSSLKPEACPPKPETYFNNRINSSGSPSVSAMKATS